MKRGAHGYYVPASPEKASRWTRWRRRKAQAITAASPPAPPATPEPVDSPPAEPPSRATGTDSELSFAPPAGGAWPPEKRAVRGELYRATSVAAGGPYAEAVGARILGSALRLLLRLPLASCCPRHPAAEVACAILHISWCLETSRGLPLGSGASARLPDPDHEERLLQEARRACAEALIGGAAEARARICRLVARLMMALPQEVAAVVSVQAP